MKRLKGLRGLKGLKGIAGLEGLEGSGRIFGFEALDLGFWRLGFMV